VLPLFERGELRVPIAAELPLDRAAEAYEAFAAGGKLGKIVIVP
jgi:NADPH:quinone reductase-like Zn-dependent oxidoreductase